MCLAGLWLGLLVCIAALAAPTAFSTLAAADAGRFVARLFAQEAYVSLAMSMLLVLGERWRTRGVADGSTLNTEVLLVLGALFCTVAGYFALQPMMAEARAGQGRYSFSALHAVSGGLFALKALLVAALAWRLAGR